MALIDKETIRAEIERRLKNTRDYMNGRGMKYKGPKYHIARGKESAYDAMLNILDSLPEQPAGDGLEEEIARYLREECSADDEPSISDIARHFAEWGAEHLKR